MCSAVQSSRSNRCPRPVVWNHEIVDTLKGASVLGIHSVAVALPILVEEAAEAGVQPALRPADTVPVPGARQDERRSPHTRLITGVRGCCGAAPVNARRRASTASAVDAPAEVELHSA